LIKEGRHSLACRDVEGMESALLQEVEFYFGGSPWQRLVRNSEDVFVLVTASFSGTGLWRSQESEVPMTLSRAT
jgi:hypothetical protein